MDKAPQVQPLSDAEILVVRAAIKSKERRSAVGKWIVERLAIFVLVAEFFHLIIKYAINIIRS